MHFIQSKDVGPFPRTTKKVLAAVCCHHEKRDGEDVLVITSEDPIRIVKMGTSITALPGRVKIISQEGEAVRASHKFWVTLETFNPYHLVFDHLDP